MKIFSFIFVFISTICLSQTTTDHLINSLKYKKPDLEKLENFWRFCPTCEINQEESFSKSRTVLQSHENVDKRSTYYFNWDDEDNLESVVISGFRGIVDDHYLYLMDYGLKNDLVSKKQAENPGRTNFTVTVRKNRFNCLLVKRITSKGVYYFIKFTYIAVPSF